ncbi:hypothetical protein [Krasilnikovia sp. MM14-A1004]|uniref:hypothetical protein n=1 Tax=Krasilnikovia sp. MM14-A1004 TaxID=3373541 RepID=UPI00399CCE9F
MAKQDLPDPLAELEEWAKQTERRVRNGRRRSVVLRRVPLIAAGTAALVGMALVAESLWPSASGSVSGGYPTAGVPEGVTATTSKSAGPTDPFAGTPAADYPKGASGITLPRATAVPGFTATQVDTALKTVRKALVAGRLDSTMLTGHDPSGLLALLAPNQRDEIGARFKAKTFTTVATWIDPAVRLDAGEQPRVSGRVTYTSTTVDGIKTLRVTTNFIWVYAFVGPDQPLAAAHDEIQWEFPATAHLRARDRGMWIGKTTAYTAWVDCAASDQGLLAPTRPGVAPQPVDTEDPDALLKADHAVEIRDECP